MADKKTSFGYLLPTREAIMAPAEPDFASMINLAETAERQGFESVWVGDSILARPRLEALTTLAAIAGRTSRVKLGTAVYLPAQSVHLTSRQVQKVGVAAAFLIAGNAQGYQSHH